jgi:hypothetical protein
MEGPLFRAGPVTAAAALVVGVVAACSTPEDPAIPPIDSVAGVYAADAGPVVETCVGAPDGANCGGG